MKDMRNSISIDYKDNPDLQEAFAGKKAGDRVKVEIEFLVTDNREDGMDGSIDTIKPDGYKPKTDEEPEAVEPDANEEPVSVVIAARQRAYAAAGAE